jgi:hypothetical protein
MNELTFVGIMAFGKTCHWFKVTYISLFFLPTAAVTYTTITLVIGESSNLKNSIKMTVLIQALLCGISHF